MKHFQLNFELTKGQKELIANICRWYRSCTDSDYVYSGPAGTGKTSVIPFIINELGLDEDEVLFVAFTGKAASVLMRKGFPASTIHSSFFDCVEVPKMKNGEICKVNGRIIKETKFVEKSFIDPSIKLIILDEWSMVNDELAHAIYKHKIPVIASGDSYQLEPVFGESPFARKVKYELTEITRQGKESGIVQLATLIRKGEDIYSYKNFNNDAWVMSKDFLDDKHLLSASIVLCARNKTRNVFNDRIRELYGYKGKLPDVGEKLICRKNCWTKVLDGMPLINGTSGIVLNPIRRDECDFKKNIYRLDFQPDFLIGTYDSFESIPADYKYLNEKCGNKDIDPYNYGVKLEYGYALSVHLSQGSEYENVIYWDEWCGDREYMKKLRYTAITRARKKVIMYM